MGIKRFLVCPDIHVPLHDKQFISLTIKIIKMIKPDGFVSLGDGLDFHQISSYDKDPARKNTIGDDIAEYNQIINQWSAAMPKGSVMHFLSGNHETRLQRYVSKNARDLFEICRPIQELLRFPQRNAEGKHRWIWHPYEKWNSLRVGNCTLMHGFYYNQHVAMTALAKYKTSIIFGHTHRFQMVTDGNHFACSLGHGSNEKMTAHQPTPTGWQQALGILTVVNGITTLEPILVNNGRCVLYGKEMQT